MCKIPVDASVMLIVAGGCIRYLTCEVTRDVTEAGTPCGTYVRGQKKKRRKKRLSGGTSIESEFRENKK